MNTIRKDISELKEELSDISRVMHICEWNHHDIRHEMERMRYEFVSNEDITPFPREKTSQTHINHFFGIKKSILPEMGVYQQRIEMYKNKNSELENELYQVQSKYNEQIKENETQIKKIEQLLSLINEINV